MLKVFAVLAGGVVVGRVCSRWRLAFVGRVVTCIIWLLLFLLGVEVGSDPDVVGGLPTLGWSAFVLFAGSTAGSILLAWLLWRGVKRRAAVERAGETDCGGRGEVDAADGAASL